MDIKQYEELRSKRTEIPPAMIRYEDAQFFIEPKEGTLLWGYTCERYSFHVYLKDGMINRIIYSKSENKLIDFICGKELKADVLYPDKRLYPEATSYDFVVALRKAGQEPSITNFNEEREVVQWYGKTYQEVTGRSPFG